MLPCRNPPKTEAKGAKKGTSRKHWLCVASHAILESGSQNRPKPERGIETRRFSSTGSVIHCQNRPKPERGIETAAALTQFVQPMVSEPA